MQSAFGPSSSVPEQVRRIRLRHLRCFVTVAREGQVGRAAELLQLSQPAVTKTLNELEVLAGAKLLDRGRHGARLTAAGHRFLRYAQDVTTSLDAAVAALAGAAEPAREPLRIGSLPTVAGYVLPEALAELRRVRADLDIRIRTDPNAVLLSALAAGALDVVLGRMAEPSRMVGLSFELLYAETLILVVRPGHPLAGRSVSVADTLEHPLVVATSGTVPRHATEALFERHGLRLPVGLIETLDLAVARGVVRRSDAVWITTERAARDDLADGVVRRLDVPTAGTVEPVGVLRRSADASSAEVEDFVTILRDIPVDGTWQDFLHG
ncbi:LysR family transcripitonal regulator [Rhodococcus pyridinivorans SB3094]|uniref:LysR family transcripitonal regulator n=1 Tax=Rhodococcus pyridinivorans SB3094 TaxID=1435356 RepID=V9XDH4_9NOCA|nr:MULTISPECIES: LysR substrate-binding domain-containing protein [Rhodococcus]AHD19362.1 LysR family transcripitonal regulator [Rhodococcus pyridinivorans SB3094]MCT7290032.1 LysR substrate-binding domain-containing protein [Rhodococcus sp. PAE-6]